MSLFGSEQLILDLDGGAVDPSHCPGAAAPCVPTLSALSQTRLVAKCGKCLLILSLEPHLVTPAVHITERQPGGGCPEVAPGKDKHS